MPRPSYAAWRTEEFRSGRKANGFLGPFQIAEEYAIGVTQNRSIRVVMVGHFVSGGLDPGHKLWLAQSAVADEEKSGFGVVLLEDLENSRCEDRVRTIVEGKGNEWKIGSDSIVNVGGEPLERTEDR